MARGDLIVGLDAGTSVIKAVAFDLEGRQVAMAGRRNDYDERPGGAVEQDMAATWATTAAVLRELAERVEDLPGRTMALALTGQGDGTWLVDRQGEPVGPGWLWLDSRAAGTVEALEAAGVRERLFRITGCGLNACNQSSQLLWMKRHEPERLERAATAFHCTDWLYLKLTGERATDTAQGTYTFGDFRTRAYVPEVLDLLECPELARLQPPMLDGAQATHALTAEAAAATGFLAGTPVALGYLDIMCAALGAGLYDPEGPAGCSIVGSTGVHMRLSEDPDSIRLSERPEGYVIAFPLPGSVVQLQTNMAATLNIDWIVECAREAAALLGHDVEAREALLALDRQVLDREPGAALYHPYIHQSGERGPFLDVKARASFTGLSNRVGFGDLVRGVYEGLGFAARDCYAAMGEPPAEIRLAGGAARSKALKTILAGALGVPVRESTREEAGAVGAAMMASVAIGLFADLKEAVRRWVRPTLGERLLPEPALVEAYDRLFPVYKEARLAMGPVWCSLAEARTGGA